MSLATIPSLRRRRCSFAAVSSAAAAAVAACSLICALTASCPIGAEAFRTGPIVHRSGIVFSDYVTAAMALSSSSSSSLSMSSLSSHTWRISASQRTRQALSHSRMAHIHYQYGQSGRQARNMYSSADMEEMLAGGERYEMVQLPDSLVPTTLFVGNLCEFVNDGMLSELFQQVSALSSLPACVARKPNASSKRYGFVTFPSVKEKEMAIIRFSGYELNGRKIKVEPIIDKPGCNRVRVPGKLVAYTLGNSQVLRRVKSEFRAADVRRISRDDVTRLIRGEQPVVTTTTTTTTTSTMAAATATTTTAKTAKTAKKRDIRRSGPHRLLTESDRAELERSERRGYVSLDSTGFRRGRKGSALANVHRQWCDARAKPQVVLCKASGGRRYDNVVIDFSPLRIGALSEDASVIDEYMTRWKADVLIAAENANMTLRNDYIEDNSHALDVSTEDAEDNNYDDKDQKDGGDVQTELVISIGPDSWASQSIWRLPVISMGVFEGERTQAKAMASELASRWRIIDDDDDDDSDGNGDEGFGGMLKVASVRIVNGGNAERNKKWNDRSKKSERKRGDISRRRKGLRQHRGGRRDREEFSCW